MADNVSTEKWISYWKQRKDDFASECYTENANFITATKSIKESQLRVLEDIISISRDSLHWTERGYTHISNETDFRNSLPVMRYEDFVPYIEKEIVAKGGVLTCSPIMRWLKTSGTTGTPKRVPYTLHWVLNYRIPAMKAMWGTYLKYFPELLAHPYATLDTQTVREKAQDFINGIPFQSISNRNPKMNSLDWNPPWYEAPWFNDNSPVVFEDKMYLRVRHLLCQDLYFINAINPSMLLSIRETIILNKEKLINEVRLGIVEGVEHYDPNPLEADRLEAILKKDDFTFKDIWPTLGLYSCWLSASAGLYQQALNEIFPGVNKLPFMSCGTEGVLTIPVNDDAASQPLAVTQAFYEFVDEAVPLSELIGAKDKIETLLAHQVEVGKSYHVIMSQANGLYRLWTGDIYHVDKIVDGTPWIHFVHRDGVFHSFTGEKLTEQQVTAALAEGFSNQDRSIGLYLCGPQWGEPPKYVVVAEAKNANESLGIALSESVEQALQSISIEYESKRVSNRLDPIEVHVVPENSILSYIEKKRQKGNANQYKYKPFQKDTEFVQEIKS